MAASASRTRAACRLPLARAWRPRPRYRHDRPIDPVARSGRVHVPVRRLSFDRAAQRREQVHVFGRPRGTRGDERSQTKEARLQGDPTLVVRTCRSSVYLGEQLPNGDELALEWSPYRVTPLAARVLKPRLERTPKLIALPGEGLHATPRRHVWTGARNQQKQVQQSDSSQRPHHQLRGPNAEIGSHQGETTRSP
jgi:hypothetical protein